MIRICLRAPHPWRASRLVGLTETTPGFPFMPCIAFRLAFDCRCFA